MSVEYIKSIIKQFEYYKSLAEKTFSQLNEQDLLWRYNEDSNSISMIVNHLSGNMLSRWTDFLTTDGEKEWRNRDSEFEEISYTKAELMQRWNTGWTCLFDTLKSLKEEDFDKVVYTRNQGHSVIEAINRQLAHYPYHIGQIVFIGKMLTQDNWQSLSIPKGNSKSYNQEKFTKDKQRVHFTDEYLKKE